MARIGLVDMGYPNIADIHAEHAFPSDALTGYARFTEKWNTFCGLYGPFLDHLYQGPCFGTRLEGRLEAPDGLAFLYRRPPLPAAPEAMPFEVQSDRGDRRVEEIPMGKMLVLSTVWIQFDISKGRNPFPVTASASHAGELVVAKFRNIEQAQALLELNANPITSTSILT